MAERGPKVSQIPASVEAFHGIGRDKLITEIHARELMDIDSTTAKLLGNGFPQQAGEKHHFEITYTVDDAIRYSPCNPEYGYSAAVAPPETADKPVASTGPKRRFLRRVVDTA